MTGVFGFRADSLSRLARYLDESTRSRGVSNGVGLGVGGPNSGWNPRWPVLWAETQFGLGRSPAAPRRQAPSNTAIWLALLCADWPVAIPPRVGPCAYAGTQA